MIEIDGVRKLPVTLNETLARKVRELLQMHLKKRDIHGPLTVQVAIDADGDEVLFVFWVNRDDDRDYIDMSWVTAGLDDPVLSLTKAALRAIVHRDD